MIPILGRIPKRLLSLTSPHCHLQQQLSRRSPAASSDAPPVQSSSAAAASLPHSSRVASGSRQLGLGPLAAAMNPALALSLDQVSENLQRSVQAPEATATSQQVSTKHAAVLVPLFQDPSSGLVSVLLTQRTHTLSSHKGEVCLPGGKRDESDPSVVFTALREAQEELGLEPEEAEIVCSLPPLLSKHYLSVTPVVAKIPASFRPRPNPDEVAAVFSMPLATFLEPPSTSYSFKDMTWEGFPYRAHFFDHEGFTVWGLTAAILIQVAKSGYARPASFQEIERNFAFDGQRLTMHTHAAAAAAEGAEAEVEVEAEAGVQAHPVTGLQGVSTAGEAQARVASSAL